MPRIRTLKPEAPQHRKVGRLSIWARWLWVVMITQADDEGRLVADPGQLRVIAFGYDKLSDGRVMQCLEEIQATGLIRLYTVEGTLYADFPSWEAHQRISHPCPSKLPSYQDSGNFQNPPESSSTIKDQGRDQGSRNGREWSGSAVVMSDDQFIDSLQGNAAYQGIDVKTELAKMDAWLMTPKARGRKKTRQFIVNWLNRVDKPVAGTTSPFDARTAENIRAGQAVLDRLKGKSP
jgi:hypothetical protein